jgi:hypothetical protein
VVANTTSAINVVLSENRRKGGTFAAISQSLAIETED